MLGRVSLRAAQEKTPVGHGSEAGPDFAAVDTEHSRAVDIDQLGAGLQAGQVGSGLGFGKALAPTHLPGEQPGQQRIALGLGTEETQRVAEMAHPFDRRGARPAELVVENRFVYRLLAVSPALD